MILIHGMIHVLIHVRYEINLKRIMIYLCAIDNGLENK